MPADLRFAIRSLLRQPGFTVVAVLTLALGIGANTAIFSVIDGVLLRPVPFDEMDRLVMVWETDRNSATMREPASVPDFLDFEQRSQRFEGFGALMALQANGAIDEDVAMRLTGLAVSDGLLPMLGVPPILGRAFTAADGRANAARVVLVSEGFWRRALEGDQAVIGRVLQLDEVPHTIVGIVADEADLGVLQILASAAYARAFADGGTHTDVDVWVPLEADPARWPRETHPIFVIGRLHPNVAMAAAQDEMTTIASDLERSYPENDGRGVFVESLSAVVFGPVRPALLVLVGASGLVLLVACANLANLLLVRATTRVRQVAVRQALGADHRHLVRQFLVESLVLTLAAMSVGVLLAAAGLEVLITLAPADIPRLTEVGLDGRVLAVMLVLALIVGVVFAMLPLGRSWRVDLQAALKGDDRGGISISTGRKHGRVRAALIVAEVALAVLLVVGAGLLIRSFWALLQVDPGFRATGVLKAEYQLPRRRYPADFSAWPNWKEIHAFNDMLARRAMALPGVQAVAVTGNHPLDAGFTNSFVVIGREAEARDWPELSIRRVTAGYFQTVALSLVRGRLIDERDDEAAPPAIVINEAAARRFFGGQDPIGQQIRFYGVRWTIVGVVANERFHGLAQAPPLAAYTPLVQNPSALTHALLVRVSADPGSLAPAVHEMVRDADPAVALFGVEPLDETVSRSVAQRRFVMLLVGSFAALAMVLAAVGIHGVLSYDVARRAREIGIRMALGARGGRIVGLVVGEGLALTSGGLVIGLAGALALSRLFSSLLFGIHPTDPVTFLTVSAMVLVVALVACYVPARRAARVDPMHALRSE